MAVFGEQPSCRTVLTPLHSERCCSISDEGRSKSELLQLFPFVASWEGCAELVEDWTPTGCSDSAWKHARVPAFLEWLAAQPDGWPSIPLERSRQLWIVMEVCIALTSFGIHMPEFGVRDPSVARCALRGRRNCWSPCRTRYVSSISGRGSM
eukprot:symbB.v1.2.022264.t1/scaffold1971.1/size94200/2